MLPNFFLKAFSRLTFEPASRPLEIYHIPNSNQGNYIVAAKENNQQSISGFFQNKFVKLFKIILKFNFFEERTRIQDG